jgi:hypothetical protein
MRLPVGNEAIHHHLFVDNQSIVAQEKDVTEYITKKIVEKYQRWGLNVNIFKTKYLNV